MTIDTNWIPASAGMTNEASMSGAHYIISDLHLSPDTPGMNALFDLFLERYAQGAASLTINGDFFNAYFGFKQLRDPFYEGLCRKLETLVKAGKRVTFTSGNRDFLFWKDARCYGCEGHKDDAALDTGTERVSVIHGDAFCLNDRTYLRYRHIIRALPLRLANYIAPASLGFFVARKLREASMKHQQEAAKPRSYYDIKDEAVIPFIQSRGCDTLVCGHIHQSQERSYTIDGRKARLLVLSDWTDDGAVIARAEAGGRFELVKLTRDGIAPWPHEVLTR